MIKRDGPLAVGVHYIQRVAGPGGRELPADIQVTTFEPDTRVAFHGVSGPLHPDGSYTLASVEGGTSVSLGAELTGIKKLVMGKRVQQAMDAKMASPDKAKALLESRA